MFTRRVVLPAGVVMLLLLAPATRHAAAEVIFDFSGICQSGDCEPGTDVTGELRFTDDAPLTHRDRLVTPDDFVSLTVDYFVPIHRVRVTSIWSPTTVDTPILPIAVVIDPLGLMREVLLRDELKNRFQVADIDNGGGWEYRHVKTAPDGTTESDLSLVGIGGAFGRRRSSVPEPATLLLLLVALAGLALQRKASRGSAP
jgi:hypothetical protein